MQGNFRKFHDYKSSTFIIISYSSYFEYLRFLVIEHIIYYTFDKSSSAKKTKVIQKIFKCTFFHYEKFEKLNLNKIKRHFFI